MDLMDSSFVPGPYPPTTILDGGSQVAMTPDCFVWPLTPLRGAVVNQALPTRGELRGAEKKKKKKREKGGDGGGRVSSLWREKKKARHKGWGMLAAYTESSHGTDMS